MKTRAGDVIAVLSRCLPIALGSGAALVGLWGCRSESAVTDSPSKTGWPGPALHDGGLDAEARPDSALDPTFGSNGVLGVSEVEIVDFATDSRSRIVLGGHRFPASGSASSKDDGMHVRRLAEDGKADTTFGQAGAVSVAFPELTQEFSRVGLSHLFLEANDGIVFSGLQEQAPSASGEKRNWSALARLFPDGTLAPEAGRLVLPIGDSVKETQYDRLIAGLALSDGRMVYAGSRGAGEVLLVRSSRGAMTPGYGEYDVRVFPGTLGTTGHLVVADQAARTKTGDLVVAGGRYGADACPIALVSNLEGEPAVRTLFVRKCAGLSRLVLDGDGNIIVVVSAETANESVIVRIRPDGTLDPTFGTNGEVAMSASAVAVDSQQRLLLLKSDADRSLVPHASFHVLRLLRDGSLDESFHDHGTLSSAQMADACPTCSPEALDCLKPSAGAQAPLGLLVDGHDRGIVITASRTQPLPNCVVRFIP